MMRMRSYRLDNEEPLTSGRIQWIVRCRIASIRSDSLAPSLSAVLLVIRLRLFAAETDAAQYDCVRNIH